MDADLAAKTEEESLLGMHTLIQTALDYKVKGNPSTYNVILSKLQNTSEDEERRQIFLVLPRSISVLTKDLDAYHELIHRIYTFDFMASQPIIDAYIRLITHFVTAHTSFLQPTIHMLVRNFLRVARPQKAAAPAPPSIASSTLNRRMSIPAVPAISEAQLEAEFEESLQRRFASVHVAFAKVLDLVPTSIHHVFPCLCDQFPHKRLDTPFQLSYLNNLFKLTTYAKGLQERVVGLVVEKLVAIDVEIKLDATEEDVFTMDDFLDDECCIDPEHPSAALDEMADKLDHLMLATFSYLESELATSTHLFAYLLKSFDQSILNTHRSKYPQFLIFYVAKHSIDHQEHFLSQLISVSLDTKVPPVTRLSCSSYLASYVARAKYLSITAIKHTLFHLLRHIHNQVDILEQSGDVPDKCLVDIIQTACYIACFRGLELCSTETGYNFVRSLGWHRVLTCSVQPMRQPVFHASVASEFLNAAELLGLVSEDSLESLLEGMKPAKNLERSAGTPTCFFPFDPYLLRRSFRFIGPQYLYWKHADPNWSGNSEAFSLAQSHMKTYDEDETTTVDGEDENASMASSSYASLPGSYIRSSISEMSVVGSYPGSEDLNEPLQHQFQTPQPGVQKPTLYYHDEEEIGF
ncbi:DNA independent RNA polymerase I transcription factor [Aphanomyces cochlioides]|nr:DNA independent RNA polymerase I transcription factor [Aphanomyces cochlioides]